MSMKFYSNEEKQAYIKQIGELRDKGYSCKEIAEVLYISEGVVRKLLLNRKEKHEKTK